MTIDTQNRKMSTISKVSITYNDKIDLRDKTERFINDTPGACLDIFQKGFTNFFCSKFAA